MRTALGSNLRFGLGAGRSRQPTRMLTRWSTAIVKALGKRQRRLWFKYEHAADQLRALREAAYFDAGIEHGVAAARSEAARGGGRLVRQLAERLVVEALRGGLARDEAAAATLLAAWGLIGRRSARRSRRRG